LTDQLCRAPHALQPGWVRIPGSQGHHHKSRAKPQAAPVELWLQGGGVGGEETMGAQFGAAVARLRYLIEHA